MNIGTIGTGTIVNCILDAVEKINGIKCKAIYSRKETTGKQIAEKYNVKKVYTDLEYMLQNIDIDFVYVASPNSLHYEHVKKALEFGKNVICEKPFTSTYKEAEELINIAKSKKLFLYEAITTMYMPNFKIIKQQLHRVGRIRLVTSSYCQYSSRYDSLKEGKIPNVFNPEFSGGCIMDINFYNIYFMLGLFGIPCESKYYSNTYKNGIDTSGILTMKYPDFVCECTGAKDTWGINSAQIMGEDGYIYIKDGVNSCKEIRIVTKTDDEIFNNQSETAWFYEFQELNRLVNQKDYTDCYSRMEKTLDVVKFIENVRKEAGIVFKADN